MIISTVANFYGATKKESILPVLLIHLNIVTYALCYWMQRPVTAFIIKELGADAVVYGQFQSALSVMALIGGPMMGRLTDVKGSKIGIIISQCGSTIMYATLSIATNLPLFFFSTFFSTVQHAMQSAQASITILTDDDHRALALGKLSLSYGIGMVTGSSLGGYISNYSYYACPAAAALVSAIVVILNVLYLPPLKPMGEENKKEQNNASLNFATILNVLRIHSVRNVLTISIMVGLGSSCFQSMFPVIAQEEFKLSSQDLGYFMSFGGIVGVVSNVLLVGPVTSRMGEYYSTLLCLIGLALSYIGYSITTDRTGLIGLTLLSTCSSSILYVLLGSIMSKSVQKESSGTAISLSHASRSMTGIAAPLIGGYVYSFSGKYAIGVFSCICCAIAVLFAAFTSTLKTMDDKSRTKQE